MQLQNNHGRDHSREPRGELGLTCVQEPRPLGALPGSAGVLWGVQW